VGADGFAGIEPIDLMAAEAPVLANQLISFEELGSGVGKLRVDSQLDDGVVTLEARSLPQPLGVHRILPEVIGGVPVFVVPILANVRRIRGMRGVLETGPRSLAFVAARAAELLHRMRAGRGEI